MDNLPPLPPHNNPLIYSTTPLQMNHQPQSWLEENSGACSILQSRDRKLGGSDNPLELKLPSPDDHRRHATSNKQLCQPNLADQHL